MVHLFDTFPFLYGTGKKQVFMGKETGLIQLHDIENQRYCRPMPPVECAVQAYASTWSELGSSGFARNERLSRFLP